MRKYAFAYMTYFDNLLQVEILESEKEIFDAAIDFIQEKLGFEIDYTTFDTKDIEELQCAIYDLDALFAITEMGLAE